MLDGSRSRAPSGGEALPGLPGWGLRTSNGTSGNSGEILQEAHFLKLE